MMVQFTYSQHAYRSICKMTFKKKHEIKRDPSPRRVYFIGGGIKKSFKCHIFGSLYGGEKFRSHYVLSHGFS